MSTARTLSLLLLIGGIVLLGTSCQQSRSFGEQLRRVFAGELGDRTVTMAALGGASTILGLIGLTGFGGRRASPA